MTIEISPEADVQLTKDLSEDTDLQYRLAAIDNTIKLLEQHGLDDTPTQNDREVAANIMSEYVSTPKETSKSLTHAKAAALTPASCRQIRGYIDEYGRKVIGHAVEIRHLVANRLLEESQNADPRIRIKALELLGKMSDVGLFTERTEITVTHQTTDELRDKLREKMRKLVQINEDYVPEDAIVIGDNVIDVDEELGFTDTENYDD